MKLALESAVLSADIVEQINLLLATPVGTVVFDRDFGIDMSFIDMPVNLARTMAAAELAKKIRKYIPGFLLKEIKEEPSQWENGQVVLKVVVELAG